jgi:hypothetical protein
MARGEAPLTPELAATLRDLVRGVLERNETSAVGRLLERLAAHADAAELRAALVELGARTALRLTRGRVS